MRGNTSMRSIHAILGLFVGAFVDLAINLLASAIQQREFPTDFSDLATGGLVALSILGLLIGYWLGGNVTIQTRDASKPNDTMDLKPITMTRLRAFYSYITIQGSGIHLSDIFVVGSEININAKQK